MATPGGPNNSSTTRHQAQKQQQVDLLFHKSLYPSTMKNSKLAQAESGTAQQNYIKNKRHVSQQANQNQNIINCKSEITIKALVKAQPTAQVPGNITYRSSSNPKLEQKLSNGCQVVQPTLLIQQLSQKKQQNQLKSGAQMSPTVSQKVHQRFASQDVSPNLNHAVKASNENSTHFNSHNNSKSQNSSHNLNANHLHGPATNWLDGQQERQPSPQQYPPQKQHQY